MEFSKAIIEKVYEVRRMAEPTLKAKIKLSSESLFDDLQTYYKSDSGQEIMTCIEQLFSLANLELVSSPHSGTKINGRLAASSVKTTEDLAAVNDQNQISENAEGKPKLRKMVYRGQVTYVA